MTAAAKPLGVESIFGALLDADGPLLKAKPSEMLQSSGLMPADFFEQPRAALLFKTIVSLAEHGRPINANTVFQAARISGPIDASSLEWLIAAQASNSLDRASFEQVAQSFRIYARGRSVAAQMRRLADALEARSKSVTSIGSDLSAIQEQLDAEYEPLHGGDEDVLEIATEWDFAGQPGTKALLLPTRIKEFDDLITGFQPHLNMIIGDPSSGKSALAAVLMDKQLEAQHPTGFFGLEDGTRWFAKRLFARDMNVPVREVGTKPRTPEQDDKFLEVTQKYVQQNKLLITYRRRRIGLDNLLQRARVMVRQYGVRSVWIDNLKMVTPRPKHRDPRYGVSEVLDELAIFGQEEGVPVLCLAHTKRPQNPGASFSAAPPRIFDIAETADAERYAFNIFGLWRKSREAMRCTVLKAKEALADVTFELDWLAETALVSDEPVRINLSEERRKEREVRESESKAKRTKDEEEKWRRGRERRAKEQAEKAAAKAKAEAEEAAKKPTQQSLLGPAPEGKP